MGILSRDGVARIRREIDDKRARHLRVCSERDAALELSGDGWHDNPELNRVQQMEAALSHEIARLRGVLETATLFEVVEGQRPVDRVRPGSVVEIECTDERTGDTVVALWILGGDGDSDRSRNALGWDSPLARAIAGACVGDMLEDVILGPRTVAIEILALHARAPKARIREAADAHVP
ncbi:MAG: GreA/GreB family elongation factor [Polyangiaceae bacterium]|nr:GreA/GreB family elongation factor [Polyangiaceae bacterium]MCB9629741.1 GreA/GreB family elongation factor [Sandaracinaceae bacterium]